ncbi:MAG TPA: DNA ligase [Kofleriaceae bacterium]|nr:DNA ligase [Kofleriaceae bacterium]
MPDIADGETALVQGSAKDPYVLKNVGGVYSCSCPAWRNAGGAIDARTCKHLKAYRGAAIEAARMAAIAGSGGATAVAARQTSEVAADHEEDATPTTGAPVLLAQSWDNSVDLTGWWISEKLDGVRAYWDGGKFVSRLGNAFVAPAWFTKGLPDHPLDGELWVGRKEFQATVSIVRRQDAGDHWKRVTFLIFDAPSRDEAFEDRVAYIESFIAQTKPAYARAVAHARCESTQHLRAELARIEALGGEGLMLRQPGSRYEIGRSYSLLKVKSFFDAEATVVEHSPGKGKHKGRLGALVVRMPNGTKFNVGTGLSDAERKAPPPIGSKITYRYQELSKDGVPRFPSYVGLAIDK